MFRRFLNFSNQVSDRFNFDVVMSIVLHQEPTNNLRPTIQMKEAGQNQNINLFRNFDPASKKIPPRLQSFIKIIANLFQFDHLKLIRVSIRFGVHALNIYHTNLNLGLAYTRLHPDQRKTKEILVSGEMAQEHSFLVFFYSLPSRLVRKECLVTVN